MIKTGTPYQDEFNYDEYYGVKVPQCDTVNMEIGNPIHLLDIYITTFDGLIYVKYQIKMLRWFLRDVSFKIIIADTNSHINPEISEQTKQLCIEEGVCYIKMPHN